MSIANQDRDQATTLDPFDYLFNNINSNIFKSKMKRIQGSDIAVTKDDQANINNFSRLYSKNQDNEGVLASLSEKISQHKDTLDEL